MPRETCADKKEKCIKPFKAHDDTKKQKTVKEMIAGKDFSLSNIQNISFEDLRLKLVQETEQRSGLFEVIKHRIQKILDQNIISFIISYFCEKNQLSADNADLTGNYMENEVFYIKTPAFYAKIPLAFFNEAKDSNYNYEFKHIPTKAVAIDCKFDSKMSISEIEYALKVIMLKVLKNDEEKNIVMLELKGHDQ